MLLCAAPLAGARVINVRGQVTVKDTGEPLRGVSILNGNKRLIGSTNMEGRFTVSVDDNSSLTFSCMAGETMTEPVNGRHEINVVLTPKATELEEVVVMGKANKKALEIGKADLDVIGSYIHLKKQVKIPHQLFSSGVRMIVQPSIYNGTRRSLTYLKPAVLDGWRYADTQERMYDWDLKCDTLTPYRTIKHTSRSKDDIVTLHDSLYVDNPNDDYLCMVVATLENYNRLLYVDTFMIARGTVNPLRFLNYSLTGLPLTDKSYLPEPEVFLRDTRGQVNLNFEVSKSQLDLDRGNNRAELQKMLDEFKTIESDPDMMLKGFDIHGTASPEGRLASNQKLARDRMTSAMNVISREAGTGLLKNATVTSDASVATWDQVVKLLREDGRNDMANQVQDVIDRYSNPDQQWSAMRKLPFYASVLQGEYLPKLRTVEYRILSSRYRPLSQEEILQLYRTDSTKLTKYNFWKLYEAETDTIQREKYLRQALKLHPDFLAAANDLSELLINKGKADDTVLAPFFTDPRKWKELPAETRYNQAVSSMQSGHISRADSLMSTLPDTPEFHKGIIYTRALNGDYAEVVKEISEDSPLNEVLLLLAMKSNDMAWEKAQQLGDSAIEEYIKATCANRVDDYLEARAHLDRAFQLDPSLKTIARMDGDIVDMLEEDDIEEEAAE